MKSFCKFGMAAAGVLLGVSSVMAQGYGSPTLLPLPPEPVTAAYPRTQPSYTARAVANDSIAPEPIPAQPIEQPMATNGPAPNGVAPTTAGCTAGTIFADDNANCGGDGMISPWCGPNCCSCGWFGSVGGMVLSRDRPNAFWTSYESQNNFNQVMNTRDADADWRGGGFVSFGKWFGGGAGGCGGCCDGSRKGIEFVYFTVSPLRGRSTVFASDPGNGNYVSSTIDMNGPGGPLEFPDGNEVDDYFDNSLSQTISRRDMIQNIEINFLNQYWNPGANCQVTWLAGIRWFQFDENLKYSAVAGASTPSGADFAVMKFNTTNDLVGVQLGARCDYYFTQRFSVFATPKFGFYGNHMTTTNQVYNGDRSYLYNFNNSTNGVSFLGQIDVGTSYQFTQHWRAFIGYRALAVTGIALSDNQIPHYLAAADELQQIDRNGSLILHGGFAGVEFCY